LIREIVTDHQIEVTIAIKVSERCGIREPTLAGGNQIDGFIRRRLRLLAASHKTKRSASPEIHHKVRTVILINVADKAAHGSHRLRVPQLAARPEPKRLVALFVQL
jgi:hypothetical protein